VLPIDRSIFIQKQPQATQFLCDRCQVIFQDDRWYKKNEPTRIIGCHVTEVHHPTYDGFINSVIQGCYICVFLWERIPQDARISLPTLCSDRVLSRLEYHIHYSDESRLRRIKVYTLRMDATVVLFNSLPTNSASRSCLSVVLYIVSMNCH